MAKQSSVNLDITNNADGFDISGGTTVRKLGITGGDVTIAGSGSATVTFPTTSTTIAGLGITQSFTALQSFSAGISAAGGVTLAGILQGTTASFTGLLSSTVGFSGPGTNLTNVAKLNTSNTFTSGSYLTVNGVGMFAGRVQVTGNSIIFTEGYDDGTTTLLGQPGSGAANTVSLPQTTGTVALTNSTVASFNGLTGAVTGVTVGGTNVFTALNTFNAGISASGGVTFSSAISVNSMNIGRGAGGTAINYGSVAIGGGAQDVLANNTTGIENTAVGIGALQDTISGSSNVAVGAYAAQGNYTSSSNTAVGSYALNVAGGSQNTAVGYNSLGSHGGNNNVALGYFAGRYRSTGTSSLINGTGGIYIGYQARASLANRTNEIVIGTDALGLGSNTAVIGATAQTAATIYGLMNLPGGLSASGITVGGSISLQNQEFIRNTTNGRMDFMPAPAGSTHYGMYMDFTSWQYGTKLGTIRASDGSLNAAGFLFESSITIGNNVRTSLGSNGQNGIVLSDTGNDTIQLYTSTTSGTNSGAIAIVDVASVGAANRSPGVTHTNPNLYVYSSGSVSANDFVRMEHNGTVGRIVSGGTSGISLEPGSGVVGISGGISLSAGITFADQTYQISKTPDFLLFSMGIV